MEGRIVAHERPILGKKPGEKVQAFMVDDLADLNIESLLQWDPLIPLRTGRC
jgi:hypothetical protein